MNIYVGNLSYKVNEEDLKKIFEKYGEVNSVKIIIDKYLGRSKGFGFVTMDDEGEAKKAIESLNGSTIENRIIRVNESSSSKRERNENRRSNAELNY